MDTVLCCVVFFTLLAGVLGDTVCPNGWVAGDTSCYLFAHYPLQFNEAKSYCAQHHGHLAEISSSSENNFIKEHLRMSNARHWWLGLTDQVTEGAWIWESDKSLTNYTDWYPGDSQHVSEDCAILAYSYDFRWADVLCTGNYGPICEINSYSCLPEVEIVG